MSRKRGGCQTRPDTSRLLWSGTPDKSNRRLHDDEKRLRPSKKKTADITFDGGECLLAELLVTPEFSALAVDLHVRQRLHQRVAQNLVECVSLLAGPGSFGRTCSGQE